MERRYICEKVRFNYCDKSVADDLKDSIRVKHSIDDEYDDDNIVRPLQFGCMDHWTWSKKDRSQEVVLSEPSLKKACFHPNWSKGTAGVRGTRILNNGRYFWEIHVSHRVFGTSMMFGVGTKDARLHADKFINMLGEDNNSWGLSHKGCLWHGGAGSHFTKRFTENQATRIGLLFDGVNGTLTYFKDGRCLGVAFRGLNEIKKPLYPIVTSTAAKTEMILGETRRDFVNLQDRCRAVFMKRVKTRSQLDELNLPHIIVRYLANALNDSKPFTPVESQDFYMV